MVHGSCRRAARRHSSLSLATRRARAGAGTRQPTRRVRRVRCCNGRVATAAAGVLQRQLRQETKKCIITGSEKPHHALPRCCCGGGRSLADRWARDGPASYRLSIFISHTATLTIFFIFIHSFRQCTYRTDCQTGPTQGPTQSVSSRNHHTVQPGTGTTRTGPRGTLHNSHTIYSNFQFLIVDSTSNRTPDWPQLLDFMRRRSSGICTMATGARRSHSISVPAAHSEAHPWARPSRPSTYICVPVRCSQHGVLMFRE